MIKIWFKTITDKRIVSSAIYHYEGKFEEHKFDEYLRYACHEMDIPTPVVMNSHVSNFVQFNICRFNKTDFVEYTHFDEMTLENCPV